MCSICRMTPCHPRCPNAPEPKAIYHCSKCGGGIYEGEKYITDTVGEICWDCLESMTVDEWLDALGLECLTAEMEE